MTPRCLGFGEGLTGAGPLRPLLRGSLEAEVDQIMPRRPYSACQAALQPHISPGRLSCSATPPCLVFGEGPTGTGPSLPAQIKPGRPNSARPAAVQPLISPGCLLSCATHPCLGFHEGAVSSRKWPKLSLGDLTPPAQGPSSPQLARASLHAVQHLSLCL